MRSGLAQAGVGGRLYLFKHDQFNHDLVQVRLNTLVGPKREVGDGTMQGRRTAVHEFNLSTAKQVGEMGEAGGGVALDPDDGAVAAWARSPVTLDPDKQSFPRERVRDVMESCRMEAGHNWDDVMSSLGDEGARQLALD